jgi:hypothetical protein
MYVYDFVITHPQEVITVEHERAASMESGSCAATVPTLGRRDNNTNHSPKRFAIETNLLFAKRVIQRDPQGGDKNWREKGSRELVLPKSTIMGAGASQPPKYG